VSELVDMTLLETIERMEKAVQHTREQFSSVRTGRATPALVERIIVEYYGSEVPLQQLAGFNVPEGRLLVVQPFDKGSISAIEKALRQADLGVNPSSDGNVIRLSFPPLTTERRKEFVKVVKHMGEEGRIGVRNARRDARQDLEKAEKAKEISQDDLARGEKELDKITAEHVEQIDHLLGRKEQELLED
jgi:ribosome recycling factor